MPDHLYEYVSKGKEMFCASIAAKVYQDIVALRCEQERAAKEKRKELDEIVAALRGDMAFTKQWLSERIAAERIAKAWGIKDE